MPLQRRFGSVRHKQTRHSCGWVDDDDDDDDDNSDDSDAADNDDEVGAGAHDDDKLPSNADGGNHILRTSSGALL